MPRVPNTVLLEVDDASPALEPVASERVLRYMIEFWNPDRALVTNNPFRESVNGPEQLGWLNYRADSRFSEYLPSEVSREPFNGGILIRIGDGHPLTENNTTEAQIGTKVQQAISAQG